MSREQKIASLLMLHLPGTDAAALSSFIEEHQPGGMILMGDNIAGTVDDTAALTRAATIDPAFPPLIAIDQEGGDVRRLGGDDWASALTLKDAPAMETTQAFAGRARLLAQAGVNINFGIVADVTADPASFIYRRALGTTPEASAERVAAAVTGEKTSVLSTLKHFPGHGAAPGDSHTSVPSTGKTLQQWNATDAVPFRSGIAAGAPFVMVGHLRYDAVDPVPASLSAPWQSILRDQLGFDGITITDDILMLRNTGLAEYRNTSENAIRSLAAGMTMLLYVLSATPADEGADPAALVSDISAAVDAGRISDQQIEHAARKLLFSRFHLSQRA
ncbi:glycoside hydrolase family 3 protein [Mycetocola manganoxydans]|uniref:beta-N-acetylhexosaminidase n=1 Tax=Mycetocola manganoxydans TaxID=699879 RepID=A0A3L6ZVJ2_9MICO|nr:glycoside hydrolase family 3 N-terminal domain-containing protein [Mycetocola manganoxydans]RLP71705.1 glycoside hydrolase family 3 protein [Mycetocola manganoxydans]GHD39150.1 beta-N-acetylhexosaminidase [Mycetocola manganoxydans]